ncbi:MAG: hypothetical protein ACJATT_001671 [Myxococcota bacterium]|jgi:hypothetical protein
MRTLLLLLSLAAVGCVAHRGAVSGNAYYADQDLEPVFRGRLESVVAAYRQLTENDLPARHLAAVEWLQHKPDQVATFEQLARTAAASGTSEEAAGAWLLMGHAWLYVAENGRRLPPPAYSDQQGAQIWDEVVSRLIDPRFDDLESQAIDRLRRVIELAEPRSRYREAAEQTLSEIQMRRGAVGHASGMYYQ